jgi:hypothetical protein
VDGDAKAPPSENQKPEYFTGRRSLAVPRVRAALLRKKEE